jgi:hypothetical protein
MKRRQFMKLAALTAALGASVGVDVAGARAAELKQGRSVKNRAQQVKVDSLQGKVQSQQFKFRSNQGKVANPVLNQRARKAFNPN